MFFKGTIVAGSCDAYNSIPVHVIRILRSRSRYAMICNSCNYHISAFTISKQMVLFCSPPICSMKRHGSLHLPKDLRATWEDTVLFCHFSGEIDVWRHPIFRQSQYLLVGGWAHPFWNIYSFVSWDDEIPNCFWKVIKFHGSSHHQAVWVIACPSHHPGDHQPHHFLTMFS